MIVFNLTQEKNKQNLDTRFEDTKSVERLLPGGKEKVKMALIMRCKS